MSTIVLVTAIKYSDFTKIPLFEKKKTIHRFEFGLIDIYLPNFHISITNRAHVHRNFILPWRVEVALSEGSRLSQEL